MSGSGPATSARPRRALGSLGDPNVVHVPVPPPKSAAKSLGRSAIRPSLLRTPGNPSPTSAGEALGPAVSPLSAARLLDFGEPEPTATAAPATPGAPLLAARMPNLEELLRRAEVLREEAEEGLRRTHEALALPEVPTSPSLPASSTAAPSPPSPVPLGVPASPPSPPLRSPEATHPLARTQGPRTGARDRLSLAVPPTRTVARATSASTSVAAQRRKSSAAPLRRDELPFAAGESDDEGTGPAAAAPISSSASSATTSSSTSSSSVPSGGVASEVVRQAREARKQFQKQLAEKQEEVEALQRELEGLRAKLRHAKTALAARSQAEGHEVRRAVETALSEERGAQADAHKAWEARVAALEAALAEQRACVVQVEAERDAARGERDLVAAAMQQQATTFEATLALRAEREAALEARWRACESESARLRTAIEALQRDQERARTLLRAYRGRSQPVSRNESSSLDESHETGGGEDDGAEALEAALVDAEVHEAAAEAARGFVDGLLFHATVKADSAALEAAKEAEAEARWTVRFETLAQRARSLRLALADAVKDGAEKESMARLAADAAVAAGAEIQERAALALRAEVAAERAQLADRVREAVEAASADIRARCERLEDDKKVLLDLMRQARRRAGVDAFDVLDERRRSAEALAAQWEATATERASELVALQASVAQAREEAALLRVELEALRASHCAAKDALVAESGVRAGNGTVDVAVETEEDAPSALRAEETRSSPLDTRVQLQEAELAGLRDRVASLEEQLVQSHADVDAALQETREVARREVAAKAAQVEALETRVTQVTEDLARSTAALEALRADLAQAHEEVEYWRAACVAARAEGETLRASAESHSSELAAQRAECEAADARAQTLEERLREAEQRAVDAREAMERVDAEARAAALEAQARVDAQVRPLESAIADLEARLEAAVADAKGATEARIAVEQRLAESLETERARLEAAAEPSATPSGSLGPGAQVSTSDLQLLRREKVRRRGGKGSGSGKRRSHRWARQKSAAERNPERGLRGVVKKGRPFSFSPWCPPHALPCAPSLHCPTGAPDGSVGRAGGHGGLAAASCGGCGPPRRSPRDGQSGPSNDRSVSDARGDPPRAAGPAGSARTAARAGDAHPCPRDGAPNPARALRQSGGDGADGEPTGSRGAAHGGGRESVPRGVLAPVPRQD